MMNCKCRCGERLLTALLLVMVFLIPASLNAQDARGNITGRVADSSGAVVAGAEVRATNTATGVSAIAKTNEAGNYMLAYLIPGKYDIEAEISGFKKFVRKGIEVR
ncbi:MAG: carboxypeptidase-like regulatory domain-containing protein, partial [Bryobacteraceae bacterium]